MLDVSKLTDFFTEWAGQAVHGAVAGPQGITGLLADAGVDPSTLEGEVLAVLSEHGIDPTQFAPEELAAYVSSLGDGTSLLQGGFGESRQG
ncbi:MAG: hypothetical protein J0H65_15565 [Rhizobiales bacterium]|jgi:hypothetical protein|nr:hypothetical protein [Hyphomicrobiales bacterium]